MTRGNRNVTPSDIMPRSKRPRVNFDKVICFINKNILPSHAIVELKSYFNTTKTREN